MKSYTISALSAFMLLLTAPAMATTFPTPTTPFSQYGQIQNVQNYSSNPFWDPSSPYNQRMPVPVYVTGTDIDTADCTTVVGALVASFCATRNNCVGMDVNDARPTITVQLASLPNHNYVTPCAGYIDSEFDKYVSQNAVAAPTGKTVAFPTATTANPTVNQQNYQFTNPYDPKPADWQIDMMERKNELQNLQSANTAGTSQLARASFPTTAADLSFTERIQNDAAGYAPYAGKSAYEPLNIESEEKYLNRMRELYGQNWKPGQIPDSSNNDSELALNRDEIIQKITTALKDAKK